MSIALAGARAAASRSNGARACWGEGPQPLSGPGAKSRGPKTPEGKARSAQNALRHGLRAQKFLVVGNERPREFDALEAALVDELAPEGTLQGLLAGRIARAAWRLERAERIEAEVFAREMHGPLGGGDLGLALIRDCNGARAFDTLLRYRGSALAELWRALRLLKALQAEPAPEQAEPAPELELPAPEAAPEKPIEPEARANPGETAARAAVEEVEAAPQACAAAAGTPADIGPARPHPAHAATAADAAAAPLLPRATAGREQPIEPEARSNPGGTVPEPAAGRPGALRLAGHAVRPDTAPPERRTCARSEGCERGPTHANEASTAVR